MHDTIVMEKMTRCQLRPNFLEPFGHFARNVVRDRSIVGLVSHLSAGGSRDYHILRRIDRLSLLIRSRRSHLIRASPFILYHFGLSSFYL